MSTAEQQHTREEEEARLEENNATGNAMRAAGFTAAIGNNTRQVRDYGEAIHKKQLDIMEQSLHVVQENTKVKECFDKWKFACDLPPETADRSTKINTTWGMYKERLNILSITESRLTTLESQLTQLLQQKALMDTAQRQPPPSKDISKLLFFDCPAQKDRSLSDPITWIYQLKNDIRAYRIPYQEAYEAIAARMPISLGTWMEGFEAGWRDNVTTKEDFIRYFEIPFLMRKISNTRKESLLKDLRSIKFDPKLDVEGVRSYSERYNTMARICEISSTDVVCNGAYEDGLPYNIKAEMRRWKASNDPATIATKFGDILLIQEYAEKLEDANRGANPRFQPYPTQGGGAGQGGGAATGGTGGVVRTPGSGYMGGNFNPAIAAQRAAQAAQRAAQSGSGQGTPVKRFVGTPGMCWTCEKRNIKNIPFTNAHRAAAHPELVPGGSQQSTPGQRVPSASGGSGGAPKGLNNLEGQYEIEGHDGDLTQEEIDAITAEYEGDGAGFNSLEASYNLNEGVISNLIDNDTLFVTDNLIDNSTVFATDDVNVRL